MLRRVTVEILLLGTLEVRTASGSVGADDFRSLKAKRVFEVLALAGGQAVSKDALVDTLWRRRVPQHPAAAVEVAVSLLRSTLARIGAADVVVTEQGGYRLDPAAVSVDLLAFDHAVMTAEHRDDADRVAVLRPALEQIRGVLLADEPALDWLLPHRERTRRRVELARLMLARSALAVGDTLLAVEAAEAAWTGAEVVLEEAYAIAADALLAAGRRSDAAALLAEADERLRIERASTAGPPLLAVRERLERPYELRSSRAPVPLGDEVAALPWPLPFLGRTEVLATIDQVVAARVSATTGDPAPDGWVHVVGRRGMGRTRLLDEVAARLRSSRPDAIVFRVQCRAGDDAVESLVAARLARLVGVRGQVVDASLFLQVATAVEEIGPTVVLVDDVHQADEASVAVLRALVAPGGAPRCAVVSTGAAAPDLARTVGHATVLSLGPLTADDLRDVGGGALWRVTFGHPTVLAACARSRSAGPSLDEQGTQDLRSIVGDLGPVGSMVVGLVARSAAPVDTDRVSALTGLSPADVTSSMVEAEALGVLLRDDQDRLEVSSPLIRALFAP